MVLEVNGEDKNIKEENITVSELLTMCEVEMPDMVSVQLNGEFVNREDFQTASVKNKDKVDFLYFMGGGN